MSVKRVTIAQHERALVWKNGIFWRVLEPGVSWLVAPLARIDVQRYDIGVPEFENARIDFLLKEARATMERYFQVVELGDREAGLVYQDGKLAGVLAPGKRQLYWRSPIEVRVEKIDIANELELSADLAKLLVRARAPLAAQAAEAVSAVEVPDSMVGLLIVDGEFVKVLEPGLRAFWKF